MKIGNTGDYLNYFKIHNNKNRSSEEEARLLKARQEDQVLDSALYTYDMGKMMNDISKADALARRLARGEELSKEEMDELREIAPDKLKEAEDAKKRAEEIKEELRKADSPEARDRIISSALAEVHQNLKSGSLDRAAFLMEALEELLSDEDGEENSKSDLIKGLSNYIKMKNDKKDDFRI